MELIILRHGEAGARIPLTSKDAERSLTAAGKQEIQEVSNSLKALKIKVDLVVTSPLRRCLETAQIVAKELNRSKELETWDELKPEGERSALYARLSKLKQDSSVLVVGHEPYLSLLISELISGNTRCRMVIKKAGLAKVEVSSLTPRPSGELRWLLTPRQVKRLS